MLINSFNTLKRLDSLDDGMHTYPTGSSYLEILHEALTFFLTAIMLKKMIIAVRHIASRMTGRKEPVSAPNPRSGERYAPRSRAAATTASNPAAADDTITIILYGAPTFDNG